MVTTSLKLTLWYLHLKLTSMHPARTLMKSDGIHAPFTQHNREIVHKAQSNLNHHVTLDARNNHLDYGRVLAFELA